MNQYLPHQPPAAAAALRVTEELRATLRHALQPAEPRYTVLDRAMLGAASIFGGDAYQRMRQAVEQRYVPGVIADLDRFAGDLRREMGMDGNADVQCRTAEVYIV